MAWSTRILVERMLAAADVGVDGRRRWDMQVHDERVFGRILRGGTLGLGEAYLDEWWDCDALDEMFHRALRTGVDADPALKRHQRRQAVVGRLVNWQTRRRSRTAGVRHYNLGHELFAAMLDPMLQYSCAYYEGTDDLAEAQRRKLDLICRKLDLRPGLRLLDIGCGWGGLARYVADHYGCHVVGVTLSEDQAAFASASCQGRPIEIRLQDYRDVPGAFDRIVSVGMMEHVGWRNYRRYFEQVHRLLPVGGLFLCHTIGGNVSRYHSDPWITRYIFPHSMLPSAAQVARAAEGLLVLEDTHNFGAHYDRTLCAWERNISAAWPRLEAAYGERFRRMWRYYLLSCAGAFRARTLQLYQFVFSKGGIPGGYRSVR